jgi:hypothetical protein
MYLEFCLLRRHRRRPPLSLVALKPLMCGGPRPLADERFSFFIMLFYSVFFFETVSQLLYFEVIIIFFCPILVPVMRFSSEGVFFMYVHVASD